jgi:O-antigen/teichoic acid export membrane protein
LSDRGRRHFEFARFASNAVISQALISAASFAIGLILIRRTSDVQYGYYVLASSAILLLSSLQNAFFNPPLARRVVRLDAAGRSALVGGLYREQRRIVPASGAIATVATLLLWYAGLLDPITAPLVLATIVAAVAVLHREYFRMVLFAYRNPRDVLRSDVFYVALLVVGALLATFTPQPAIVAVVTLTLAAVVGGALLARTQRLREPWDIAGAPGVLRDIAPLAMWSVSGAAIHWSFSQGYMYVVAGTLDVASVAAIAATRLLLMPVNLLSTSMGPLMLPLTSGWLHEHGPTVVLRRLSFFALGLAAATTVYFGVLWLLRDWIFLAILKKHFPQSDTLLVLWGLTFLVTVVRSQFNWLLAAEGRFRYMTLLTLASAGIALATSYFAMLRFGTVGAVAGILLGEVVSAAGIMSQVLRRTPDPVATPA